MVDHLQEIGIPDDQRINTSQEHEIQYWKDKLMVTREQLLDAVQTVGNSADAVRRQLGKSIS